jgi:hypothetical protein
MNRKAVGLTKSYVAFFLRYPLPILEHAGWTWMNAPISLLTRLAKRNRQEESIQNCSDSPFNNYESEIRAHTMVDEGYARHSRRLPQIT